MFLRLNHSLLSVAILVLFILLGPIGFSQQATRPVAIIDAAKTGAPIDPLFYGKFTELLGNMFEKGVWAEMISDRKFFYPVNSNMELTPPEHQVRVQPLVADRSGQRHHYGHEQCLCRRAQPAGPLDPRTVPRGIIQRRHPASEGKRSMPGG